MSEMASDSELACVEAWYYNPSGEDSRLPHQYDPNRPVPPHHLTELGVLIWELDADHYDNNPQLEKIKKDRGYNYSDIVTVAPGMMEDYDAKIKHFFTEHLHAQEEIRFVLEGGGYFDVRDYDETWIRFRIRKGHLIVLPPGMYHRFTLDTNNYVKAMRLFMGLPCWTQHQRPADDMEARRTYIAKKEESC
ncbi:hypothetical protein SUGI_0301910 [Cryptomeria japonica]|nr:hypothetical protein SUGI_0301910 [Cryptomeria japonica]